MIENKAFSLEDAAGRVLMKGTGNIMMRAVAQTGRPAGTDVKPSEGNGSAQQVDYRQYPILVVDDEPENLVAFELNFRKDFKVLTASSGAEGLSVLADNDVALVISDQRMPGMTGVKFLEEAGDICPNAIRMILTGYSDIQALIDAVNNGRIWHYITKPWDPDELQISIRRALDNYRLAAENRRLLAELSTKNDELADKVSHRTRELEEANEKLRRLAVTDGLTGLYNHRFFTEKLDQEVMRAERFNHPISVLMLDVDYFKKFNDTHGHPAGDEVLKRLAFILVENVREVDTVARYGGEEFVVVLPQTDKKHAEQVAEKIRSIVASTKFPNAETQPKGKLTVSIGVACLPMDGHTPAEIVLSADNALYKAKGEGRNKVVCA